MPKQICPRYCQKTQVLPGCHYRILPDDPVCKPKAPSVAEELKQLEKNGVCFYRPAYPVPQNRGAGSAL